MVGMPRVLYSIAHRVVKCICLLYVQQEQCMLSTYIVHELNMEHSTHVDKTHMKQKCLIVQVHCDNKLCIVIHMHIQAQTWILINYINIKHIYLYQGLILNACKILHNDFQDFFPQCTSI